MPAKASEKAPPKKAAKPKVLRPLLHQGKVIEPGSPVPADLSEEAVGVLARQGYVG